jgi:hypothetical protein
MIDAREHELLAQVEALQKLVAEQAKVIAVAIDMRRLQRVFFRIQAGAADKKRALDDARVAEQMFDRAAAELKSPGLIP